MPSVWLAKRRNKHGINYLAMWEIRPKGTDGRPSKGKDGKPVRIVGSESCGPSKEFAFKRVNAIREELYAGKLQIKPAVRLVSVPNFAEEYLRNCQTTKALNTFRNFDTPAMNSFKEWFGNKPLSMIETQTLFDWRDALLDDDKKAVTVDMRLRALCTALNYAKEKGYVTTNPFDSVRKSSLYPEVAEVARYISQEEIKNLIPKLRPQVARAFYFMLHTGLRHEELLSLDWKMIHAPTNGLWTMEITRASAHGIASGKNTKTGKSRIVKIPDKARTIEVLGNRRESGKVFYWKTRTVIGKDLRLVSRDIGLGRIRAHDIRHTWATNFMYKTGNVFELLYYGGWSSMASAAVYQHIRRRDEPVEYPEFPYYFHTKRQELALTAGSPRLLPSIKT